MTALEQLKEQLDDLSTFRHGQPWRNAAREIASALVLPLVLMVAVSIWASKRLDK